MGKKIRLAFDISQTGKNKAGCGFFAHAMISAMLKNSNNIDFKLLPHFGDFYHDSLMPSRNPYSKGYYGPRIPLKTKANQLHDYQQVVFSDILIQLAGMYLKNSSNTLQIA